MTSTSTPAVSIPANLTKLERDVLQVLTANLGRVVTREAIAASAAIRDIESNVLEVIVYRIRKKLKDFSPALVVRTVRAVGYYVESAEGGAA